ncbi:MAG: hypothetical protein EYC69_05165 [Bacteroidetes bacterium]|nr:MAG: hypothetical protein EYC69_05165 [Bacteroidota bacterium]
MKLLFDQNISFRIIKRLEKSFPESGQVKVLGLENFSDMQIWNYAKENRFSIVTFDSDFFDIANLFGHPPKIIWLRMGNYRTKEIAELLISKSEIIMDFISNPAYKELACIEISG